MQENALKAFGYRFNHKLSIFTLLKESFNLFVGIETLVQFCLYLCCIAAVADQGENSGNAIVWNTLELLDFTLTFYYQTDSNTLYDLQKGLA